MKVGAGLLMVLATGCVTTATDTSELSYDNYGRTAGSHGPVGGKYAPGDRLYRNGHIKDIYARDVSVEESRKRELVAYEGIEGARLAHRIFGELHAEELDGACESKILAVRNETLDDIANFCDVSYSILADFNPSLYGSSYLSEGQELNIPHASAVDNSELFEGGVSNIGYIDEGINFLEIGIITPMSGDVHHVAAQDSLSAIAIRYGVSAASVANLNPGVDWNNLSKGRSITLPAERIQNVEIKNPVKSDISMSSILAVSQKTLAPGESVTLTAFGLPASSTVEIYRGANRRTMKSIGNFDTDASGDLRASAKVPTSSGAGGVVFAATVDGEFIYSPRVTVWKLKNNAAK